MMKNTLGDWNNKDAILVASVDVNELIQKIKVKLCEKGTR